MVVTLGIVLPWRADLVVVGSVAQAKITDTRSIAFDSGLTGIGDGLLVAASGSWDTIYFGPQHLSIADHAYGYTADFHTFPRAGGLLLVPLRPLIAGTGAARLQGRDQPGPVGATAVCSPATDLRSALLAAPACCTSARTHGFCRHLRCPPMAR